MENRSRRKFERAIWVARARYARRDLGSGTVWIEDRFAQQWLRRLGHHVN